MPIKDEIAPELPFLRRYARALTGSQDSGDAFVRATLKAILADPAQFDRKLPPRVALFQLFHTIWGSSGSLMDDGENVAHPATPGERLAALSPRHRQALLLTAMEGFTLAETALILDVERYEAEELIALAQSEIERQLVTTVLIIEDEPIIALHLSELLREIGHDVVGVAVTHKEAVTLAKETKPGLVLADIQLADSSSGINAVKDILDAHDVPVIFITAFPERLLTGTRPEPTYLVTKPFLPESVIAAVGQALFFHPDVPKRTAVAS